MTTADRPSEEKSPGVARRGLGLIRWAMPAALLALMPKCPLCVAAYIAVATGVGVSLATATFIRTLLLTISIAALAYLVARSLRGWIAAKLHRMSSASAESAMTRN
jgi:hypothetical protein